MTRNLCTEVEKALGRLEDMCHSDLPKQELANILHQELSSALQELEAASAELMEQNDELASSRLALEDERRRYQELFEFAPDGYLVTDTEGVVLNANNAAVQLLNVTKQFLIGMPLALFVPCAGRTLFRTKLSQIKNGTCTQERDWEFEMFSCKRTAFPVSVTVGKVATARGETAELRWLLRDITDRRQIEKELQKADKLESLGILAGGIAHDFNNYLTIILGNLSLAKMYTRKDNKVSKYHREMEDAIHRTRGLIGQLLTFAKGGEPLTEAVSIRDFLEEVSSFSLSGSKTRCKLHIDELPPMEIDSGQITQVINNLLINADQAMPTGGTITIKAEQLTATENSALPLYPGDYIAITITDEGTGIPQEHLSNIFDPYYSTKELGNGLGLTICYSILKRHGGHISVSTVEGQGTSFTIYLPVSRDKAKEKTDKESLLLGEAKVLFMDDEEDVRNTVGEMLTFLGYNVDLAVDGEEAIRMYKEALDQGNPYDVVITDLTVRGGMGGKEAVRQLKDINPDVKAIVSSGYSNDTLLVNYKEYGFSGAVAKPFKLIELGEVLSTVLGKD